MSSLPETQAKQLINHVLFNNEYNSVAGKEGFECFLKNLITEREFRNLFIAHSVTEIAKFNKKTEPNFINYSTKELCQSVELAFFGKVSIPTQTDTLDPWEINIA